MGASQSLDDLAALEAEHFGDPERRSGVYRTREVTTVAELETLDPAAVLRGYRAGYRNEPDYAERDKGYWHGYLNGQVDGKYVATPSEAQMVLAKAIVALGPIRGRR